MGGEDILRPCYSGHHLGAAKAAKWTFAKMVDQIPFLRRGTSSGESVGMALGKIVSLLVWLLGLIAVLQQLGFDRVMEVAIGADLCTIEEAKDFL